MATATKTAHLTLDDVRLHLEAISMNARRAGRMETRLTFYERALDELHARVAQAAKEEHG